VVVVDAEAEAKKEEENKEEKKGEVEVDFGEASSSEEESSAKEESSEEEEEEEKAGEVKEEVKETEGEFDVRRSDQMSMFYPHKTLRTSNVLCVIIALSILYNYYMISFMLFTT